MLRVYLLEWYYTCAVALFVMVGLYRWPDLRAGAPGVIHYVGIGVIAGLALVVIILPTYILLTPGR